MWSGLLKKLNRAVSLIDTDAVGVPNAVGAYLVTGTENALIDMGYQSSASTIIDSLAQQGIHSDNLDYLLPTHVHLDHCGSCGTLAKVFPNASILVHPKGAPHLADPTRLWNGASQLFGDGLMQRYGRPEPVDQSQLHSASNGEVINLGRGVVLRAVWTPGHASHHLSYELEGENSFFTGDAVGIYSPNFPALIPTTPPTSFDLEKTLQSLEFLKKSSPSDFFTPHFGHVANATQWIATNVVSLLQWNNRIREMKKSGFSIDDMVRAVARETCEAVGLPASQLPEFLVISIKISVLGFLQFLAR